MSWGTLYGIGVGPGDPELLTRKAFRLLASVPVIFYPACGEKAQGFALNILQKAFEGEDGNGALARCRPLPITMVRGPGSERPHWSSAAEIVGEVLQRGKDAAFITEGDPLLYSTFVYLQAALAERFPEARVEVVPGISSVSAAAARTSFPLAVADERIAVLPATFDPQFVDQALETFDTVVLMKVNQVLDQVITTLERRHLLKSAVLVERCGTPHERIVSDVASLRGQRVDYFSLLLVRNQRIASPTRDAQAFSVSSPLMGEDAGGG
ncbi:MAG: precorrin-2 C(20)-methyltransferase [Nitrospinae bacterium]|nr:precorrin-2 C(20)-methyltransferase [Nitrospinota bacterium]